MWQLKNSNLDVYALDLDVSIGMYWVIKLVRLRSNLFKNNWVVATHKDKMIYWRDANPSKDGNTQARRRVCWKCVPQIEKNHKEANLLLTDWDKKCYVIKASVCENFNHVSWKEDGIFRTIEPWSYTSFPFIRRRCIGVFDWKRRSHTRWIFPIKLVS